MKMLSTLSFLVAIGFCQAGLLNSLISTPNSITQTSRIGGNFAYSTIENHNFQPSSRTYGTSLPSSPLYSAQYYPYQFINSPFVSHTPVLIGSPIFGGSFIGQNPILGQYPFGISPPQADPAPKPVQGTIVDEDTVAVDAA